MSNPANSATSNPHPWARKWGLDLRQWQGVVAHEMERLYGIELAPEELADMATLYFDEQEAKQQVANVPLLWLLSLQRATAGTWFSCWIYPPPEFSIELPRRNKT